MWKIIRINFGVYFFWIIYVMFPYIFWKEVFEDKWKAVNIQIGFFGRTFRLFVERNGVNTLPSYSVKQLSINSSYIVKQLSIKVSYFSEHRYLSQRKMKKQILGNIAHIFIVIKFALVRRTLKDLVWIQRELFAYIC